MVEYVGRTKPNVRIVHVATGQVFYSWVDAQEHEAKIK